MERFSSLHPASLMVKYFLRFDKVHKEMIMKRIILMLVVVIILAVGSLTTFGCNSGSTTAGKYIDEADSQNFTELKRDGTFVIQQAKANVNGKYTTDGNRLILTLSTGQVMEGKLEGKTITPNKGGRWTKK
jgi:uncharacterized protein YxeA